LRPAACAIPGDITTLTGGYIYERRLLEGLRAAGRDVLHIRLAGTFPEPSPADMADAVRQLAALDPARPLILDGLVFGSIDTRGLATVRAPIVAMIHHPLAHESGLSADRRAHLYRTERDNLALSQHVIVPSPHTAAILTSEYGVARERITIIRPGTDRPAGPCAPIEPPLILSVGIQHPRKGHDVLLRALAQVTDLAWQAVIVGSPYDAPHAADLAALHDALRLGDRVTFAGRVAADRLSDLYRTAGIFALATRYEGYGIVFDEALAHGLPIVACRTGAVPQTVPPGAGLLVAPDDPAAFGAAVRMVVEDRALRRRLGAVSAATGARLPAWDTVPAKAGALLDTLVLTGL
jgi:glycosyltransferase involved in cell wall biosynthesis